MKKCISTLFLTIFFVLFPFFSYAIDDIKITTESVWKANNNNPLETMEWTNWEFFAVWTWWESGLKWFILNIARDLKSFMFVFVLFIVVIMVIKLLFANNTDEQQKKLKMWILWSSIWIMIMQVSFGVQKVFFDQTINSTLWYSFTKNIVKPFTDLLMMWASFVFITMGIYAFYKIVTAWWNEEWIKKWKMTIFQAVIWFIVIKFSRVVVENTFNPQCEWNTITLLWIDVCEGKNIESIKDNTKIIIALINWINTFLAIFVVIMIIYAGFLVMTGWWEDEKNKKAKKIILYSWIWLLVLFASYMILTFFIAPKG
jgi:hypothetical protein